MGDRVRERLARVEAGREDAGEALYAIAAALAGHTVVAQSKDASVLAALALARPGGVVQAKVSANALQDVKARLEEAGLESGIRWDEAQGRDVAARDREGALWLYGGPETGAPPATVPERALVICPATVVIEALQAEHESVVVARAWRLYGGRRLGYASSDREQLLAILLAAIAPPTLALGMNVVFDGAMKPRTSKMHFSGAGGQIGAGDALVCHPEDLNRYTPLPGAVALVLGEVTEPVEAFRCGLPVGDEVLTVVIKT